MRSLVSTVLSIALVTGLALFPATPGSHDSVAGPLSLLARALAWLSLGFVPVGALWLAFPGQNATARHRGFGIATASVASLVLIAMSGLSLAAAGPSLALLLLLAGLIALVRVWARIRRWNAPPRAARALAAYLVIVPAATLLLQEGTLEPALDRARAMAIANAAPLIAGIERHRETHGRYPVSLLAVHGDYNPGVVGVRRYEYEASGDSYNVAFELPHRSFGTQEFVVYNPAGRQVMTSHALDILEYDPAQLERSRGFYAALDTPYRNWKRFLFD